MSVRRFGALASILGLCGIAAATLGMTATDADACTCVGPLPACQAVWRSPLVFRGRVVAIESTGPEARVSGMPSILAGGSLRITFDVAETLRGTLPEAPTASQPQAPARLVLMTSNSSAACGYTFEQGEEYIVYAHRERVGEPLNTSICTRTRPVSEGADDLRYLRALRDRPESLRGRIFGRVTASDRRFAMPAVPARTFALPPDIRLVLHAESGAKPREVAPNGDGTFEFDDLAAGDYRLALHSPDTLTGWERPQLINLPAARACAERPFHLSHNGRLTGRLVDATGAPVAGFNIGAMSADVAPDERWYHVEETTTAPDGTFELKGLPPDRYLLGLNLSPRPGRQDQPASVDARLFFASGGGADASDAAGAVRVFTVDAGKRLRVGDLTMPAALDLVALTGVVLDADGRPLANAEVGIYGVDVTDRIRSGPTRTDAQGRFTLAALRGRRYRLSAQHRAETATTFTVQSSESSEFVAAAALPPFRVACASKTFSRSY